MNLEIRSDLLYLVVSNSNLHKIPSNTLHMLFSSKINQTCSIKHYKFKRIAAKKDLLPQMFFKEWDEMPIMHTVNFGSETENDQPSNQRFCDDRDEAVEPKWFRTERGD